MGGFPPGGKGGMSSVFGVSAEHQNPGFRSGMFPQNGPNNSNGVPYTYGQGFPIENTPTKNLANNELGNAERKKRETAGEGKAGVAKVRKEKLKNTPDKKIIKRGKDYRSRITSRIQTSGVTKRRNVSRPELGSRVAALLKPKKSSSKKGDKLG